MGLLSVGPPPPLLDGKCYDPAGAVTAACTALLAMTQFDTSNLRCNFVVPTNGAVRVKMRGAAHGSASNAPWVLFGVMQSTTIKGRVYPFAAPKNTAVATAMVTMEANFVVPGLTPGASLAWDAAYSVEQNLAGSGIKYGGPNNTTANDAFGGFTYEIWEVPNLLGAVLYDPAGAVSKVTSSRLAMTELDTSNLRVVFTCPTSGKVMVRMFGVMVGAPTYASALLGVLDSTTVRGRQSGLGGIAGLAASSLVGAPQEATFIVDGLTPGSIYTWDAAYGVEILNAAGAAFKYGGPNNTTASDAYGAFGFEVLEMTT